MQSLHCSAHISPSYSWVPTHPTPKQALRLTRDQFHESKEVSQRKRQRESEFSDTLWIARSEVWTVPKYLYLDRRARMSFVSLYLPINEINIIFLFIGVQLLYKVVLAFVVHSSESATCVHISPSSQTSLPYSHPTHLGHYRAQSWARQQVPLSCLHIAVRTHQSQSPNSSRSWFLPPCVYMLSTSVSWLRNGKYRKSNY